MGVFGGQENVYHPDNQAELQIPLKILSIWFFGTILISLQFTSVVLKSGLFPMCFPLQHWLPVK